MCIMVRGHIPFFHMHHFSTGLIIQYRGKTHKHVKTTWLYKVQEERSICRIDIFYFILSGIREEQVLPGAREPHAALAQKSTHSLSCGYLFMCMLVLGVHPATGDNSGLCFHITHRVCSESLTQSMSAMNTPHTHPEVVAEVELTSADL